MNVTVILIVVGVLSTETGETKYKRRNRENEDDSTAKINENSKKSAGGMKKLSVIQISK